MSNTLTAPQSTRPRLMRPPLIAPAAGLKPYRVTASDGRMYRLTPNGVRSWQQHPGKPVSRIVTFKYQRIDADGKVIKRVRMSKKNKLRLRRAVAQAA